MKLKLGWWHHAFWYHWSINFSLLLMMVLIEYNFSFVSLSIEALHRSNCCLTQRNVVSNVERNIDIKSSTLNMLIFQSSSQLHCVFHFLLCGFMILSWFPHSVTQDVFFKVSIVDPQFYPTGVSWLPGIPCFPPDKVLQYIIFCLICPIHNSKSKQSSILCFEDIICYLNVSQ